MMIETLTWLYVLLALTVILIIIVLRRCSKVRVWIKMHPKQGLPLTEIGYLDMNGDNTAGEVHLSGSGAKVPIGRVIVDGQSNKPIGNVEVLTSDIDETNEPARYMQCGYINFGTDATVDEYGYIYKVQKGKRKKELIGYCARPSDPETPTIYGERSWRTLWLVKTLCAYEGKPANAEKEAPVEKPTASMLYIGSDAGTPDNPTEDLNNNDFSGKDNLPFSEKNTANGPEAVEEPVGVNEPPTMPEVVTSSDPKAESVTLTEPVEPIAEPVVETVTNETESASEGEFTEGEPKGDDSSEGKEAEETPTEGEETEGEPKEGEEAETEAKEGEDAENKEEDSDKPEEKKKEKKKKEKKPTKKPDAICSYTGFHRTQNDLPAEARACAYAMLGVGHQPRKYAEYYKSRPYGWRDTALFTSLIYSVLFLLLYTVNTGLLQMPLLGNDLRAVGILIGFYFVLWAVVRFIKIERIENSSSVQSRFDLLNKNLNLRFFNIAIIVLGLLAGYFTFVEFDYDLLPLIFAIVFGVFINMTLYSSNKPWRISSSYLEDEEPEEGDSTELKNPDGDIARSYVWDLDQRHATHKVHGDLTLYFTARDINDMRQCNPFFAQRKDKSDKAYILEMYSFLIDHKPMLARVRYIAAYINKVAQKFSLTPLEKMQFTLDFIQEPNIRFTLNRDCKSINYYDDYIRYPDETLYDKEGDCNSKSLLAAMLFHVMGYNVLYMASRKYQHAAIGIEVSLVNLMEGWYGSMESIEKITVLEDGKRYIYCETTGDRFIIGSTMEGMTIDDFEDKVLLPLNEDGVEDDGILLNDSKTCIYNWDLDSESGVQLHGKFTLDFSISKIEELRSVNPFQYYGTDGNTYEMNIRTMFHYLFEDKSRMEKVNMLADYIRAVTRSAGCNELDTLQFALDFVQAPNIEYRVDAESTYIDAKEYMRFPDEVLFDKEGDCDCKSSLMAALFHALGYNVLILLSTDKGHAAIGLEFRESWRDQIKVEDLDSVLIEHNDRKYLYCETTGDGFRIGHTIEDDSVKNYDNIVEIPL